MLEAHLKSITKCRSAVMFLPARQSKRNILHNSLANHRARCQRVGASASNKYFIFMLAPQCGLMHNVTSAVSLQVQRVVALLHHFKYSLTVYVFQHQCHQVTFLVHDVFLATESDSANDSRLANVLHWYSVFVLYQYFVYVFSAYVTPLIVCKMWYSVKDVFHFMPSKANYCGNQLAEEIQ